MRYEINVKNLFFLCVIGINVIYQGSCFFSKSCMYPPDNFYFTYIFLSGSLHSDNVFGFYSVLDSGDEMLNVDLNAILLEFVMPCSL